MSYPEILLVHPPLLASTRYGELAEHGPNSAPFGLAYIAAVLERHGHRVEIHDAMALNQTLDQTVRHILARKPACVGISFMTAMYSIVRELTEQIKRERPDCRIALGGAHPTTLPQETLEQFPCADCLVCGEGERTFLELVEAWAGGRDLAAVQGIAYRDNGRCVQTVPRPVIMDLDELPLPAWHLLPMDRYRPTTSRFRRLPSHSMLTSRGCPMKCLFCSHTIGPQVRVKSAERVVQEMEFLAGDFAAREIIIYDSCFTLDRRHVTAVCEALIRSGLSRRIRWSCETRVDMVDRELLDLMRAAGCWSVHYGVESGSQRLLDLMNKGITKEAVRRVFRWSRQAGLHTSAFFMIGFPTETLPEIEATIAFAKEIRPSFAQFTITVPYPGTALHDLAKANGTFRHQDWDGYSTWAGWTGRKLIYRPPGFSSRQLVELQRRAMLEFNLQPRIILENLVRGAMHPDLWYRYLDGARILARQIWARPAAP